MGKSTINGHFQWQTVSLPEGISNEESLSLPTFPSDHKDPPPAVRSTLGTSASQAVLTGGGFHRIWVLPIPGWFRRENPNPNSKLEQSNDPCEHVPLSCRKKKRHFILNKVI